MATVCAGGDAHEDLARGPVDREEEVTPPVLISHLRQVFCVGMKIPGLIGLEGSVCRLGLIRLQSPQIANSVMTWARGQPAPRDIGVQELAQNSEQAIQRQKQALAPGNRYGLLRRGQRSLKLVRRVAQVMDVIALASFPDCLL